MVVDGKTEKIIVPMKLMTPNKPNSKISCFLLFVARSSVKRF